MSSPTRISTKSRKNDHISDLPDCVLSHILSRLPTTEAVKTSLLSKGWRYKWTSIHEIELSDTFIFGKETKKANFANFVERTILLSQNLQSLGLSCVEKYDSSRMEKWISTALSRNVHCLRVYSHYGGIVLPRNLLICYSLRELDLTISRCTFKIQAEVCFPHLTTLKLAGVAFLSENCDSDVVKFNFPVLKSCSLKYCWWLNMKFVEFNSPEMTEFACYASPSSFEAAENACSFRINADSLLRLIFLRDLDENFFLSRGSKVKHANLNYGHGSGDLHLLEKSGAKIRELLNGFSSLEELELSITTRNTGDVANLVHSLPKCYRMERLYLHFNGNADGLLELLHAMPALKFLYLQVSNLSDYDYDAEEYVPPCIVSHLEEVSLTCIDAKLHELTLVKFLLKNAQQLKILYFYPFNFESEDSDCNELEEELSTFPKASPSSRISVIY